MRRIPYTLAAGALAICSLLAPATAAADLTFCNKTWKQLVVNLVQQTSACSSGWGGWGWYYIDPFSCSTLYYGDLPERYYYYRADSTDGAWHWSSGSYYWWMPDASHTPWCLYKSQSSGGSYYNHRQLDTGNYTGYTLNLTTNVPNPCGTNGCYPVASDECLCPTGP